MEKTRPVIFCSGTEKKTGLFRYLLQKNKKYCPEIYINSENKIIEVKCDYTYNSLYSRNILKKTTCISLQIAFEFWIYDAKGLKTVR